MHQGLFEFLVIPFDLMNALTTFQALMNEVVCWFLHHLILVFFDDILIYSRFMKWSKCVFGGSEVTFLGHIISTAGVAID
jgi:hypothetical protein